MIWQSGSMKRNGKKKQKVKVAVSNRSAAKLVRKPTPVAPLPSAWER
jgi:hypothetical protein